jgi:hypothetical protein
VIRFKVIGAPEVLPPPPLPPPVIIAWLTEIGSEAPELNLNNDKTFSVSTGIVYSVAPACPCGP